MTTYTEFLQRRQRPEFSEGFTPLDLPGWLKDFQAHLVEWNCRSGRSATFADCGLGKTPMQLCFADNVVRHTDGRVLIATPLSVSSQTKREAEKFGYDAEISRDGNFSGRIVITNYERLHYFSPSDFSGFVCDESGAIKNFDAKRTEAITEFTRKIRYRLLCTATAAPNDFFELGTTSEALGYLGFRDMITTFFRQETSKDHRGWGRTKYRFRGHAEQPFWKWVCSFARALRRPSDLGFSDSGYDLPPLNETQTVVKTAKPRPGTLFTVAARDMREEREERRHSIRERCEEAARIMLAADGPAVGWCELNEESDMLTRMIPGALQISGSMADDEKEEVFDAFSTGQLRHLITKPKIGAWGLNWQHCADTVVFPSHSFEQYYQLVRRFWRFGQKRPVNVTAVLCEGQVGIMDNLKRKQEQAAEMFDSIIGHMGDAMRLYSRDVFPKREEVPSWL